MKVKGDKDIGNVLGRATIIIYIIIVQYEHHRRAPLESPFQLQIRGLITHLVGRTYWNIVPIVCTCLKGLALL